MLPVRLQRAHAASPDGTRRRCGATSSHLPRRGIRRAGPLIIYAASIPRPSEGFIHLVCCQAGTQQEAPCGRRVGGTNGFLLQKADAPRDALF
jgi:hypothetical protein